MMSAETVVSSYSGSYYEIRCGLCGIELIDADTKIPTGQDYEVCHCCGRMFCIKDCWKEHKKETLHKNVF